MNAQLENAEQALASVNAASGTARGLFTGLMFLTGYLAVVLASTDDLQLFLYTPIKLPFFNIDIDIKGFYTLMPWLYLIIHANMLLIFAFLTDKINHLEAQLQPLYFEQRQSLMKRLHVLIFAQYLSKQHSGTMAWIIAMIVWFSIAFVPLLLLLWVQLDFLPAQEELVIWGQRAAVAVDVGLILYFWNNILQNRRRSLLPENWDLPFWKRYTLGGYVLSFLSIACLCLSLFIVVIPFSPWDKCLTGNDPEDVVKIKHFKIINKIKRLPTVNIEESKLIMGNLNNWRANFFILTPFKQWLVLSEEIITANEVDVETKNQLIELKSDKKVDLEKIKNQILGYNARKEPYLNLRFAQFNDSILIKADLRGASLQGVNFEFANLQYVDLSRAKIQEADMRYTKMRGAKLRSAYLQSANLLGASLQGADLGHASFQGANMIAQLQGVNLGSAKLKNAILRQAKLQGANLIMAKLFGANLVGAELQGTNLSDAPMQSANLGGANLQGATFSYAEYLQGVNFDNADISLVKFHHGYDETFGIKGNFSESDDCIRTGDFNERFSQINLACERLEIGDKEKWRDYYQKRAKFIADLVCEESALISREHFYFKPFILPFDDEFQFTIDQDLYQFIAFEDKLNDTSCENRHALKNLFKNEIGAKKLKRLKARVEKFKRDGVSYF